MLIAKSPDIHRGFFMQEPLQPRICWDLVKEFQSMVCVGAALGANLLRSANRASADVLLGTALAAKGVELLRPKGLIHKKTSIIAGFL